MKSLEQGVHGLSVVVAALVSLTADAKSFQPFNPSSQQVSKTPPQTVASLPLKRAPLEWRGPMVKTSANDPSNYYCWGQVGSECRAASWWAANNVCATLGPGWQLPTVEQAASWLVKTAGFKRVNTQLASRTYHLEAGGEAFSIERQRVSTDPNTGLLYPIFSAVLGASSSSPASVRLLFYIFNPDPRVAPLPGGEAALEWHRAAFFTRSPVPTWELRPDGTSTGRISLEGGEVYGFSPEAGVISMWPGGGDLAVTGRRLYCVREVR